MTSRTDPDVPARLRRQRAVLADFGLFAFRSNDIEELLCEAARQVSSALDVDLVKILEHRPESDDMLIRAGVNWQPGVVGEATLGADDRSPGGHALLHDEPVVSPDVSKETRFRIPQVLLDHGVKSMVNVIIAGDGRPFGVLEVDAQEARIFDEDAVDFLRNYANLLAAAVQRIRSHLSLSQVAEERRLLAEELRHRVKNILALAQAVASQTNTEGRSGQEFRDAYLGRLGALSRAQGIMFEDRGLHVDLQELLARTLEPHGADRPEAVDMEGEPTEIPPQTGLTLGLVLYELATNAAKYGALSTEEGCIRIRWRVDETSERVPIVRLTWAEEGGPPVIPPSRRSFGTRMISRAFTGEPGGGADLRYDPDGLKCELAFPAGREGEEADEADP